MFLKGANKRRYTGSLNCVSHVDGMQISSHTNYKVIIY